jgi:hypothetical protein
MVSQFSDPVYISKPIRLYYQLYMTINMPALLLKRCLNVSEEYYRKFQLIFSLNKKAVMKS